MLYVIFTFLPVIFIAATIYFFLATTIYFGLKYLIPQWRTRSAMPALYKISSISFWLLLCSTILVVIFFGTYSAPRNQAGQASNPVDRLVEGKISYDLPDTIEVLQFADGMATISKSLNDSVLFKDLNASGFKTGAFKISSRIKLNLLDPEMSNA
jgi:hypothetical protein